MVYKVKTAKIDNMGNVTEGKRKQLISWPCELRIGGLYFLRKDKLYRIIEEVPVREL